LSAAVAQVFTTFVDRAAGSETWLKGPYGPPFFNAALFMGLLYGGIALGLSRRRRDAALGALGPSLGIALPMIALSRVKADLPWIPVVVALYTAAVWGTIFALGRRMTRRWTGGAAACAGAFLGFLLLSAVIKAAPALTAWRLNAYLPPPVVLLDGLLSGAGMALGVLFIRRRHADVG
jgi:hypothetical protein